MLKKNKINPYVVAIGAGFTISITLNPIANASENPFEIRGLGTGYMLADGHEGKCGEGKCGEGKCGSKKTSCNVNFHKRIIFGWTYTKRS